MPSVTDRIVGGIVGLAIGDAIGFPHEFRTVEQVRREIGEQGIIDFLGVKDSRFTRPLILGAAHQPGTFTDDTQMSLCVAESLITCGRGNREGLLDDLAQRFVEWCFSAENNRCPGEATCTACQRLRDGVPRHESGMADSKGCGANMRVIPVGLFYNDFQLIAEVARAQAEITHRHPAALVASEATAIAATMFLRNQTPMAVFEEVSSRCGGSCSDFDELAGRFERAVLCPPSEVLIRRSRSATALGEGWVAEEAFFSALYCAARAPDSFRDAVLLAANTDGDSDSIACLTGGFLGARLGLNAIPEHWRQLVERSEDLHSVGSRLSAARDRH